MHMSPTTRIGETAHPQGRSQLRPIVLGGIWIERPVILAPMSGVTDL
ncbi:MAG TPA: tRNA dihydrouridine synthase DusB, partial [Roseomonas sp.]